MVANSSLCFHLVAIEHHCNNLESCLCPPDECNTNCFKLTPMESTWFFSC